MTGDGYIQDSVYYVQIKDYQGSIRAVIDQDRRLVETNHYYPYGGLINAGDNQLQPHKYSAKELDRENGLDLYDFSARMYDPMLPQFYGVDILAEKKPWNSPYAYCGGNPILRIDLTGLDEWEINSEGRIINHIKTKRHDAFYMVDGNNKRIEDKSLVFKYGSVHHRNLNKRINRDNYNLDIYEIRGDEQGKNLFEFMSENVTSNSYVEYSIVRTGRTKQEMNYISTGHQVGKEPALTYLIGSELNNSKIKVREIGHGHPLTQGADNADITFSQKTNNLFKSNNRIIPKYFIYYTPSKEYIYYKSNSKPISK